MKSDTKSSPGILYSGDSVTWGDELQWKKIMLYSGKDLIEEKREMHGLRTARRYTSLAGRKSWRGRFLDKDNNFTIKEIKYGGAPHINIARCGMSNDLIVKETIEFCENENPEFVCVQFSVPRRVAYWKNGWKSSTPFRDKQPDRGYYMHMDSEELRMFNLWSNVLLLEKYLESKNIPHYFWRVGYDRPETNTKSDLIFRKQSKWKDMVLMTDIIGTKKEKPWNYASKETGGGHPSEEGHQLIANHIQGILPKHLYQSS